MTASCSSSAMLLHIHRVSVAGDHQAPRLRDISLSMHNGERLALIGPNGSGKSTLLRVLTSELSATTGYVRLNGQPLGTLCRGERAKRIAILAQNDMPDLRLRVEEYVALGRIPHHGCSTPSRDSQLIEEALDDTGLLPLRHRLLGTLSGGERQRAALARAFAQTPQLLLLDEPTNHLDPLARAQLLSLVRKRGISTLAVLHDLPLITPFADRVAVLQQGKLLRWGLPSHALSADCVKTVFGMNSFTVPHPVNGSPIRIFEAPECAKEP
ncbi:ABC transporter ATP-binding protein [Samsonia erythrinae]|uniref:Iron complex transport system ATP-binding protein n=1 Tax=Samsonia erythrinae TaxID=160434 RepID=A0A4R3VJG0_9GAMM|nr:ABC transporter ATP-binding protein [Samsonia erythrinae]TCV04032.1 iron complex transport system ATP-binding protein [Samsonia erythrinae]